MNPGPAGIDQIQQFFQRIINLSGGVAFVALLIMLIIGGVKFMLSAGEAKQVQAATQTITYAIIGLVFLVGAWLVLVLISSFTGVDVTKFCFGFPGATTACPAAPPPNP